MRALDRKLLRNLRRLWAQTLAIALVLGCGVMVLVASEGARRTLTLSQDAYYDRQRFADIWASATRVPHTMIDRLARTEGVAVAEGRIALFAILDVPGLAEPATARILSLSVTGNGLNLPILTLGRLPDPARPEEVAVSAPFAEANGLVPGSRLRGVLDGQLRDLVVTGRVLSPEFVYTMAPGSMMPDDRRHGILWMGEPALAAITGMGGAVNDIALRLTRDADERAVIAAADALLAPYGSTGAHGRDRQQSHTFLDSELTQLSVMARFLPPVFLVVSAFLVNMVLARLVALERTEIGLLKALGYSNRAIAGHFLKLGLLIGAVGTLLGWAAGLWLGDAMIGLYTDFYRFPFVLRDPGHAGLAVSGGLALTTALVGSWRAVRAAVALPPAEAMQPPSPPPYARDRAGGLIRRLRLRQTSLMILRSILRWPGRAAITLFGVSASVAVLVMSYFMLDAIDLLADTMFERSNRQQVTLALAGPAPAGAVTDALALPGVRRAEGAYVVPIRLIHGHRTRLAGLVAHDETAELARLIDDYGNLVPPPAMGVALPQLLAGALDLRVGDLVQVDLLSAPRGRLTLPVTEVFPQGMGQEAHVAAPGFFAALGHAPQVNMLHLSVDPARMADLNQRIKALPAVAGLTDWSEVRRQFDASLSKNLAIMVTIYTAVGLLIAVGVVYNAARIQVSERSHELATLRVMGFTPSEVGFVLVGEIALLALAAVPVGWAAGYGLALGLVGAMSTDVVTIPFHISLRTYALAAVAVLTASMVSVLWVRRRLDRIDLVATLKTRG